jgi:hypothetical protein
MLPTGRPTRGSRAGRLRGQSLNHVKSGCGPHLHNINLISFTHRRPNHFYLQSRGRAMAEALQMASFLTGVRARASGARRLPRGGPPLHCKRGVKDSCASDAMSPGGQELACVAGRVLSATRSRPGRRRPGTGGLSSSGGTTERGACGTVAEPIARSPRSFRRRSWWTTNKVWGAVASVCYMCLGCF